MTSKIFICIFFFICLVPLAVMIVSPDAEIRGNEATYEMPSAVTQNGELNLWYMDELFDYFDHSYGLRSSLIRYHNKFMATLFNESGEEKVILGKNGWLFYSETLDDYEGTNSLTEKELDSICKTLELMNEYLSEKKIDFAFTIAPNKNSLYGSMMPNYYPESRKDTNGEVLSSALDNTDIIYADLFKAFRKEDKILYRKTDSHWTTEGAGLASDTILHALGKEFEPSFGGKVIDVESDTGDLYEMLYLTDETKAIDTVYEKKHSFEYERKIRSVEDNFIRTVCSKKEGTLFMFRDSFGNTLHPFIADNFGKSIFCRLSPYNLSLAEKENADTVIVELAERNLRWILDNPPIFPAPQRDVQGTKTKSGDDCFNIEYTDDGVLEGYFKISATEKNQGKDIQNSVFVICDGLSYEATPSVSGFQAYVPIEMIEKEVSIKIA